MAIKVDRVLDAKGLACPMPIVRSKKALEELAAGQVLEVQATDKGSLADIQSWARTTGHQYLGSNQEGDILHHFVRKSDPSEVKEQRKYPNTITNEQLEQRMKENPNVKILDVREPAEFAFSRIPGAISIPLGELEQRINELDQEDEINVICRTGNRSDMASQLLNEKGFKNVKNVISGMSEWKGFIE
ncbi:sulfurtransferase TusA family protein [Paenibacillus oenotherae]|uniref:Sulfurtransferase TusA family protein n=1 Tax=Paenibacillus oenotherae TaxID=1435645 RepID=A0ABS7DCU6_9BACL|nr:sulfurtransferase TusA family protein [Paenibacillus oenotherae]MBW7477749.1 sulfurtransferase TusA family protein [Paenibacillus oenotherae]